MRPAPNRVRELFDAALDLPAAEVETFLDSACGTDVDLRRRIEALLGAHARPDPVLDRPAAELVFVDSELDAPPGYALGEEVGRGGMGVVYRARDERFGRDVAVKLLRPGVAVEPGVVARFQDEARVTARLQHPGIPPVHQMGELPDGRPFLAMKLVAGRTLAEMLVGPTPPDRGRRIAVFEAVCQAVGFAHSRGVIHRDLKPANVMVGEFGEVQVMDWGLAREVRNAEVGLRNEDSELATGSSTPQSALPTPHLTRAGAVMGTPGFMAPEQARGQPVDRRADVFGLGAVLCVLLTGHPPFRGDGRRSVLDANAAGDPTAARAALAECGAEPELVALCERCLHPDPAARPADAGEVAAAVAAFRGLAEQRAKQAEIDRVAERTRRRAVVWAAAVVVAVLAAGTGVSVWQAVRATDAEAKTRQQLALTRAAEREATESGADTRAFGDFLVNHVLASDRPAGFRGGQGKDVKLTDAVRAAEGKIDEVFAGRPKAEAAARHGLGATWQARGNLDAAERQLRRAVELRKELLGPLAPDTLDSVNSLAVVCDQLGRFDEAEALMKEALAGHRTTFGRDRVETLSVAVNLGFLYVPRGRYDEALAVLQEAEADAEKAHGRTHPVTLTAIANQGIAHAYAGRGAEAEAKLAEALAGRRSALGDKHPTTLFTMRELGGVYRRLNRRADAGRLLAEGLAGAREVLGNDHPETLLLLTKLATLRIDEGSLDDADTLLAETLPPSRRVFGSTHPHTLETLTVVGTLRERQNRPADAAVAFEEALTGFRTRPGRKHVVTANTARKLGLLYHELKKPAAAAERLAEALVWYADRSADDPQRETCLSFLGLALVELKKPTEAEPHLTAAYQALAGRKTPTDAEKERLRAVLAALAGVCDATDRKADAAEWRAKQAAVK